MGCSVWAWLVGLAGCALPCGEGTEWVDGECVVAFTCLDACLKSAGTCFSGENYDECADRCAAGTGYDPACARDAPCSRMAGCSADDPDVAGAVCEDLCYATYDELNHLATCTDADFSYCARRCYALADGLPAACVQCAAAAGRATRGWSEPCQVGGLGPLWPCGPLCTGGDPTWPRRQAEEVCEDWCSPIPYQEDYGPIDLVGCNREVVARCEAGCVAAVRGKSQRCAACLLLEDAPPTFNGDRCVEPTFAAAPACAYLCRE